LNYPNNTHVLRARNNSLTGNTALNSGGSGTYISDSHNNVLTGTNASNNAAGINLFISSYNNLTGNPVSSNDFNGIIIAYSSNNNVLTGNSVLSNGPYGIYLLGSSNNNIIFHNNLINNALQVSVTTGYVNTWDDGYPSGGNYWSDYTGVDEKRGPNQDQLGSDGIEDIPYTINSDVDRYPLMNRAVPPDFVIPEYPLGTISALVVGLIALLLVGRRARIES
jgi:parallel beta-helix repeat protein